MNEFYGFLIGALNLSLLVVFLFLLLRPVARQFFYAKREVVKKRVVSSAWQLKKAQFRLKEARERIDFVPEDISSRRQAIEKSGRRECARIIAEANELREHILENARKMARIERNKSAELVRKRLLLDAFRRAEGKLSSIDESSKIGFVEAGIEEMSKIMPTTFAGDV